MARKKKNESIPNAAAINVKNALLDIETEASIFLTDAPESEGFLPEPSEEVPPRVRSGLTEAELLFKLRATHMTEEVANDLENKTVSESDEALETAEASLDEVAEEKVLDEDLAEGDFIASEMKDIEHDKAPAADVEGTELDGFESASIDEVEFVEEEQAQSIIESILFASDRPVSFASIQLVFKGTNVTKEKIRRIIETLAVDYASGNRGIVLEEITGGYQLRTKQDNMNFIKRTIKTRAFKLSGPALETLSIVAYKQPVVKIEVDQIRGVESGHLLRALMEKGLVNFEGKAETLPGKPMQYGTTRRFLEIFGLRNLKELPTLSQIDELLPDGIGDEPEETQTLSMVTESLAESINSLSYSEGEDELGQIENQLTAISTSSEFFEQEKIRQKQKRDEEKAQNIREAVAVGEVVSKRDVNWLKKFENPEPIATEENELVLDDSSVEGEHGPILASADESQNQIEEVEDDSESDELAFYKEADDSSEEGHA